jgi:hypothetical protein
MKVQHAKEPSMIRLRLPLWSPLCTLALAFIAFPIAATSAILHVPSEYPAIQPAIDAAAPYDQVLVAPGTYTGPENRNLDFHGKAIDVASEAGPALTILDCERSGRGVVFSFGEGVTSRLDGFTITNAEVAGDGGGILISGSAAPTITGCVIAGNYATRGGGVAFSSTGHPLLFNCTIAGNRAHAGVGILSNGGSNVPFLRWSILWGNCAVLGPEGYLQGGAIEFDCCDVDFPDGWAGEPIIWTSMYTTDPRFCSPLPCDFAPFPGGDYSPQDGSPYQAIHQYCNHPVGALPMGCDRSTPPSASVLPGADGRERAEVLVLPNPAAGGLNIQYSLAQPGDVTLSIFNAAGAVVRSFSEAVQSSGIHVRGWDGKDGAGSYVPAGIYLVRIRTGDGVITGKITLTR